MTKIKGETSLETRKQAEELLAELRRQAYAEGYEQGKFDTVMENIGTRAAEYTKNKFEEGRQEKRDRIVEQAKADLADLEIRMISDIANNEGSNIFRHGLTEVDFVVNKEKRTVVALVEGRYMREIVAKGIAKCAPDDCFNEHIGKAIAIRRALGLEVPNEYTHAPQPTEVRVGDVAHNLEWHIEKPYAVRQVVNGKAYDRDGTYAFVEELTILDDSREEASEGVDV